MPNNGSIFQIIQTRKGSHCLLHCTNNFKEMYRSLEACLLDLEKTGRLVRVKELVDPYLEMAAVHLRVFENGGPRFVI